MNDARRLVLLLRALDEVDDRAARARLAEARRPEDDRRSASRLASASAIVRSCIEHTGSRVQIGSTPRASSVVGLSVAIAFCADHRRRRLLERSGRPALPASAVEDERRLPDAGRVEVVADDVDVGDLGVLGVLVVVAARPPLRLSRAARRRPRTARRPAASSATCRPFDGDRTLAAEDGERLPRVADRETLLAPSRRRSRSLVAAAAADVRRAPRPLRARPRDGTEAEREEAASVDAGSHRVSLARASSHSVPVRWPMHVVGTAGHVDHGKSTLVRALTGIDPDRFEEEKRRGLTIDLGFAWRTLPSGREIGIVDVPGHERFIRNMLAGAGGDRRRAVRRRRRRGLDAAVGGAPAGPRLPRVSRRRRRADESRPRRSRDARARPRRRLATLRGTCLHDAAIVPVSATTGAGLDELVARAGRAASAHAEQRPTGRVRACSSTGRSRSPAPAPS